MLAVSYSIYQCDGAAACLSLSPMVTDCPWLSLLVPWSYWLSLTFSHGVLLYLTVSSSSKELLHVSHCLLWLLDISHSLFYFHGVAACLSLPPNFSSCLYLSHPFPRSRCMSLTVYYGCWLSLTASSLSMELLPVFHCLPWLLALSHCSSGPIQILQVFHCLALLLAASHCLFQSYGVAACLSLSPIVAGFLLLSLTVQLSCCMSITVFHSW